ncbi:hypothetical protein HDV00_007183, partial [Rhizophlyctis rosea]
SLRRSPSPTGSHTAEETEDDDFTGRSGTFDSDIVHLASENAGLREEVGVLGERVVELQAREAVLEAEVGSLEKRLGRRDEECGRFRERVAELEGLVGEGDVMVGERAAALSRVVEVEGQLRGRRDEERNLEGAYEALRREKEDVVRGLEGVVKELEGKVGELEEEVGERVLEVLRVGGECDTLRHRVGEVEGLLDAVRREKGFMEGERDGLLRVVEEGRGRVSVLEGEVRGFRDLVGSLEGRIEDSERRVVELCGEKERAEAEVEELRGRLEGRGEELRGDSALASPSLLAEQQERRLRSVIDQLDDWCIVLRIAVEHLSSYSSALISITRSILSEGEAEAFIHELESEDGDIFDEESGGEGGGGSPTGDGLREREERYEGIVRRVYARVVVLGGSVDLEGVVGRCLERISGGVEGGGEGKGRGEEGERITFRK